MTEAPTIFFSAVEASADGHAAELIKVLKQRLPRARFIGAGGEKMAQAGCELVMDITDQASMMGGPFFKLSFFFRRIRELKKHIMELKPDVVIPVDSPALNWHVCKAARKAGSPVMYFVAPQVWAWASWRVRKLARLTDRVACILPFEEDYFRQRDVNATFVGHPLLDHIPPRGQTLPDLDQASRTGRFRVALLPGSRAGEIAGQGAEIETIAKEITERWPETVCTFAAPDETAAERIRKATGGTEFEIVVGKTPEVVADSHFAIVVSGTATLLTAYYATPIVVVFRAGWWAYHLVGWWLVRAKILSLVNILADRKIMPEVMPWFGNMDQLRTPVMEMLASRERLQQARKELLEATADLEEHRLARTASESTADLVMELLQERGNQGRAAGP